MTYRLMIVDDEPLARERLKRLLQEHADFRIVAEAGDGQAAVDWLKQFEADVVLLDIQMPGMDGLDAAEHFLSLERPPVVIFCTAYDDHALPAFRVNAADYLLKPIRKEELSRALGRAQERLQRQSPSEPVSTRTHISARTHHGLELIAVEDIRYFTADQKYVSVVHSGGTTLIDESLKQLEEEFGDQFLRTHRSTLVAAHAIERLETDDEGTFIHLRNCSEGLPVSRRHLASVRRYLKNYSSA